MAKTADPEYVPFSKRPPENPDVHRNYNKLADLNVMKTLKPLKKGDNIMFWRLQKVGSSTVLSILLSYAYRYHFLPKRKSGPNVFCRQIAKCALKNGAYNTSSALAKYAESHVSRTQRLEEISHSVRFKMSVTHDICNLNASLVRDNLQCAFGLGYAYDERYNTPVREIFLVREPVQRALSVYYFWGELFKLAKEHKRSLASPARSRRHDPAAPAAGRQLREAAARLGSAALRNQTIRGALFTYHGEESTVPPLHIAMSYASNPPLRGGFPGPSLSSSAFADNVEDTLAYMSAGDAQGRLLTLVLDRWDESLLVLSRHLNLSLADVVAVMPRKSLSPHPKAADWPAEAVQLLRTRLVSLGEYAVFEHAGQLLDRHLQALRAQGEDVDAELARLQELTRQTQRRCLDMSRLDAYREQIARHSGLPPHPSQNKLRDLDEAYLAHIFSFNQEILTSFDLCAPCEAHALLLSGMARGFMELSDAERRLEQFSNCPLRA
eukprot:gene35706-43303_t